MMESRFSGEQMLEARKDAEKGRAISDLVRDLGIAKQFFHYTPEVQRERGLGRGRLREFEADHPLHDKPSAVTRCWRICFGRHKINLGRASARQMVGIREIGDRGWLITFLAFDLDLYRDDGLVELGETRLGQTSSQPCFRNDL